MNQPDIRSRLIATTAMKMLQVCPIFNDKHLSWNWEWAKEMVATSYELGFPFMAGPLLP